MRLLPVTLTALLVLVQADLWFGLVPTAMSAIVLSSVSPERWLMTAV